MVFAYSTISPNTPSRPYLDVILRNGFYTTAKLMALVDSGADYSIFPADIATDLKLDLTSAPIWRYSGTTGQMQEARLAEVSLAILMENDVDHAFEVNSTCAFCASFKSAGGVLLGQNGFFSRFKIIFDQPRTYFEIDLWS